MPLFPETVQVIRRTAGTFVDGKYTGANEGAPEPMQLDCQPAKQMDRAAASNLEVTADGRRESPIMRAFGPLENPLQAPNQFTGHPGDLVIYNGQRWLVATATPRGKFENIKHTRYLLMPEMEHSTGEVAA